MAEARREEEEEGERRDLRDVRNRNQATDHLERTKQDHLNSSQGPLSSIRAAIKRTRTNSQSDNTRDRRRPEITIISAEPLDNNWFSGTSVVFPSSPQSGWSAGIQSPPSYDQVIKEKTEEEHIVKPTAAPRRFTCTTTCATQTEPVRDDVATTVPHYSAAPQSGKKRSSGKRPQKPPRPSLPKLVDRGLLAETGGVCDGKVATNKTTSTNTEDQSSLKTEGANQEVSSHTCTRSVVVHWDIPGEQPAKAVSTSASPAETTVSASDSDLKQTPVPRPRTKPRKQSLTDEANDQTLVKLGEQCNILVATDTNPEDVTSNKYLKELLEVFSTENQSDENSFIEQQSDPASEGEDVDGEMSQRNIRARIQAFESQTSTEDGNVAEPVKPQPLPRKANKPPVAAKPSVAFKPQFNHSFDDDFQNVSTAIIPQIPTPAPKPPPKKPLALPVKEQLETLLAKDPHRSRPPLLTRANSIYEEETPAAPPVPPAKPFKEPLKPNLNINNHNSTSVFGENDFVDSPSNYIPDKSKVDSNGGAFTRQSLTRRPTTIRVPSKTGSLSDGFQDSPPPPLPAQKPVGSLSTSVNHKQSPTPIIPSQESFAVWPEPSLPPRRQSSCKTLPLRPPPAKTNPGRPPAPSFQTTGRSQSVPWDTSPKPQTQRPHKKGPALPPRPNPGHRLYNNYTLQLPHGIAAFDYNGNNTGELSFQKNEVLLLLKEIDQNTFECQAGDSKGRVHTSHMKVITPLSSVSNTTSTRVASPAGSGRPGNGLKAQVLHDFIPEGPGELGLKAGDVVTMVEKVDSEWYRGTCRGSTGFFPINYVSVLPDSPKSLPEKKPKPSPPRFSGPRCVARFDFEGEQKDELSFSEGDVIQLKAYVGQDWVRGQIGTVTGLFPLNFVEVIEDLPPPPSPQDNSIALPGMVGSPSNNPEDAKPVQSNVEWVVALYDYVGKSSEDLSFKKGDCILITQHLDAEWSSGRLNGREGMFPRAFAESTKTGRQSSNLQQTEVAVARRARALFDFTSDCEEELSLQVGDVITSLESLDDEWFLGDLRGKRALVPKNYVKVLE